MKKQFKKGFTLAEVLITLSIIGIIAAIVMPSLITSYQYKTIGVKLSKFQAAVEQSARAYVVSNDSFHYGADHAGPIMDFVNDSFIFRSVPTNEDGQKAYLGVSSLNDAQKATVYAPLGYTTKKVNNEYVTDVTTTTIDNAVPTTGLNTESLGKTGSGQTATEKETVALLKDGTAIMVQFFNTTAAYSKHKAAVDQSKVGYPAFDITFMPRVTGMPSSVQKQYHFVVTELGYVVPNDYDTCLWNIYDADYITNSKTFTVGTACNPTNPGERQNAN